MKQLILFLSIVILCGCEFFIKGDPIVMAGLDVTRVEFIPGEEVQSPYDSYSFRTEPAGDTLKCTLYTAYILKNDTLSEIYADRYEKELNIRLSSSPFLFDWNTGAVVENPVFVAHKITFEIIGLEHGTYKTNISVNSLTQESNRIDF
ncbi:MAG: hypothetical protein LBT78_10715 [Tannerella sp.]|jgi:hypothetical protein|nr:hypothetical protein [Tannerella sp.]